uniref:Uncharacterized protein n=1 Tax=Hyaloperonospora arabidopsidis (strain Emoy2) TaxID=559515 RepID=M4BXK9_HYAAE
MSGVLRVFFLQAEENLKVSQVPESVDSRQCPVCEESDLALRHNVTQRREAFHGCTTLKN